MEISKVKFKGHETFSLREGWVYKCLSELSKEDGNSLFTGINPITRLGVGNNMTKSIRYWMKCFNLIDDSGKGVKLTKLGELVYRFDKYCADYFTLWIMHINIASNITNATAWYLYFNEFTGNEFDSHSLNLFIEYRMQSVDAKVSESSIKADVNMIIKMYKDGRDDGYTPEDNAFSPFARLDLLKEYDSKYKRSKPDCNVIDKLVVLYVISKMLTNNSDVSIDGLEEDELGVGKLLGISRIDINYFLDLLENEEYIQVVRTAGLNTIKVLNKDMLDPNKIVELYYCSL